MRSVALFLAWAIVGFVGSFLVLYGFTPLGVPIWIAVLVAYAYLPRIGASRLPEAFGALAGFGAFWLFIAASVDGDASGLSLFGALTVAAATLAYLAAGRRRCRDAVASG